jgi:hypothetical protein
VLSAGQAASGNYAAATATTSFTVGTEVPTLAFTPIAPETYGNAPFAVSATSASSGAVTYSVVSGPATIVGNTVTLTGTGTVVLSATQVASGNYAVATVTTSFTVAAGTSPLNFTPITAQIYGNAPFAVSATSASGGAVTYSVVSGPATIVGNSVTLTGTGTVVLSASQAASGNYAAATATASFMVETEVPTLAFTSIASQVYGNAPFTVNATSASSGAVTYSVVSGPATISGNTVTLTGTGTVVLSASQAASGNYAVATATTSFTVAAGTSPLSFTPIATQVYGNVPFTVSATSASSGSVTYSVVSGPATISGSTVTLTGTGTVVLNASQAANGNYAAAAATASFIVAAGTSPLNFTPIASQVYGNVPFTVNATSASSGAVTYSVVSGPATISGNTVTLTGTGTVVLSASQAASGNYAAATTTTSFSVVAQVPTLSFAAIASQTYGNVPFTVSATSASSGAVTYSVVSGPATISGNTVTLTGIGTVVLSASQAANGNYAATTATTSFTVVAQVPTLSFAAIAAQTYGNVPFAVSATSASSGAVTYSVVSGPATISGNTVTLTGTGTVVLSASQAANGNYAAATTTTSFSVVAQVPTLSFAAIASQTYGNVPFTVSATSASSGAVTYSVVSGPATISGNTLTLTGTGTVVLSASQAANGNYAATTATTSFTVVAQVPTLSFAAIAAQTYGNAAFTVSATSASSGAVTYSVASGPATILGNTVTLTGAGTVVLNASQAANGNYAATTATTSFTVVAQVPTLSFAAIAAQTYGNVPFAVSATSASSGAVTYSVASGPATILGNTVTLTGAGTVVLNASQAANGNYAATTATTNFTVGVEVPTLAFTSIAAQKLDTPPLTVSATSASSGAVTYSVASGPATISGNTVTLTGTGTVVLHASQAANGNYAAATVNTSFTVANSTPVASSLVGSSSTPPYNTSVNLFPTFSGGTAVIGSAGVGSSNITASAVSGSSYPTPLLTSAATYTLTVTGTGGNTVSTTFTVTPTSVSISPITPANQTMAPGTQAFGATASGGSTNNLTWSANAGTMSPTGSWTSPNVAGTYTITATSVDKPSVFVQTTVVVSAPVITTQPVSQNVCTNASATLSVAANFASSYQWKLGGTAISGATSSSYFIASAISIDAGNYAATVTNAAGSVTSAAATVVVGSSITKQPTSLSVFETQTATFSAGVAGVSPFTYQWYRIPSGSSTGVAISGATSGVYTTPALTTSNSGDQYYVTVTNSCSTLTSSSAALTVSSGSVPPTITTQPVGATVAAGGTTTFSVVASGTPTLTYQWYRIPPGIAQGIFAAVSGATSASYTVPASKTTTANDQDAYYVVVSNSSGQAVSQHAPLVVGNGVLLQITGQPTTVFVNAGAPATFSVTATSTLTLTYQWYQALPGSSTFTAIAGATSATYTIPSAASTQTGSVYYVVVSNGSTTAVTSSSASLFVGVLANISTCNSRWNILGSTTAFNSNTCSFQLTAATGGQQGEIIWPTLLSTGNIQLSFTITTSNPTNPPADGFAMVLGDPSLGATLTSTGTSGAGLGAEGIPGFVLAFDDFYNAGIDPSTAANPDYLGVGRGETALWENPYFNVNKNLPGGANALAEVGHTISNSYVVSIVQGQMTVTMNGTQVFSGSVSVPPVAYLYFTSSTGGDDEQTVISNIQATVSAPSN